MLHLFTLGELRLLADDGTVLSRRGKPLLLLAYLARHAPRSVPRAELASLLWGEREESRARHSLRQSLLELHKLIGDRLIIGHDVVHVITDDLELDVHSFERDVDAGRDRDAVARWNGDFLRDADYRAEMAMQAWLESERAALRRRLTLAFERLLDDAQRDGRKGSPRDALVVAKRWMELAPLDEHACDRLIAALRLAGHSAEALAVHSQFTARVREAHDAEPSREFLRLAESLDEVARGEPVERPRASLPGLVALPLVGRASATAKLGDAWRRAVSGEASVVVVIAEHGMGATRLCDELLLSVQRSDAAALVLRASGGAPSSAPTRPLSTVSALLGNLASANALGGLAPDTLASLARMLPALRTRFPHLPAHAAHTDTGAATRDAIEAAADDAPVLVIVDALTSADADSQAVLLDLACAVHGAVLVVFVLRPGDAADETLLRLRELVPNLVVETLRPLSVGDVAAMLDVAAPVAPDERLRLAQVIHADTAGAPLYAAAMIQFLLDERLLTATDAEHATAIARLGKRELPVPVRIRSDVRQQLRALPGVAQQVADAVAVLGVECTPAEVVQVTGLAAHDVDEGLAALHRAGMLRSGDGTSLTRLSPPVVERAVYALVPPLRREALHAAAALMAGPARWYHVARRDPRASYHRARAGGPAPRRGRWAVPLVAVMVIAVIAATLVWRANRDAPSLDRTVAVFPFAVSGGSNVAYLQAGMADLLSTNLDGVGGLHTLDPRVVIAATMPTPAHALDAGQARAIARRLGATYYVLGTVVGANGQLSIAASLYHARRGGVPVARASAEGSEGALFGLVDRLTAQLAVAQGAQSGERLAQLAAVTTTSLDALKAYLEGRSAYRANDLFAALPAFQRAVAADSSFALAWYGLATTASWMLNPGLERYAAAQAVREGRRLSPRDRLLVEAFAAYSRGSADSAERMATDIVETYDDIEGWVLLGEVLYHHNWKRGRQLTESRRAWERVLVLDPEYWPALQHLSEVAALQRHDAEADSLLGRYERSVGTQHMMLASRALRAYRYGDASSRASLASSLAADRGFFLTASVWYVAVYGRDVRSAHVLASMLTQPLRPPEQQGFGHTVLAHLDLAQGKWREARAELAIARALSPDDALEHEVMLGIAPFLSTSVSDLAHPLQALRRLPPRPATLSTMPWPRTNGALHPMLRAYLTGMVRVHAGDDAGPALTELADVPDPTGPLALAQSFASSIRASQLRRDGRPAEALAELERGTRETPFVPAWTSAFVSQAYERYARAELLHQLGRDDEALRWFATFGDNSPYDLVYLAPALLQQARIHDARGDRALARERYAQFVELWALCDPELQPLVTSARDRIAQLR